MKIYHSLIEGFDTGIHVGDGPSRGSTAFRISGNANFEAENVAFNDVLTPFDVSGAATGRLVGTRIMNDPKLRCDKEAVRRSTGWRRPKGPPLPIFYPNCKGISASKNYVFAAAYFHAWDNEETCPICNVFGARLSEGLFNLAGEVSKVLTAPDLTYGMLQAIAGVSRDLRARPGGSRAI